MEMVNVKSNNNVTSKANMIMDVIIFLYIYFIIFYWT